MNYTDYAITEDGGPGRKILVVSQPKQLDAMTLDGITALAYARYFSGQGWWVVSARDLRDKVLVGNAADAKLWLRRAAEPHAIPLVTQYNARLES